MERGAPPRAENAEVAASVRRLLDEGGYRAEAIQARLGTSDRMLTNLPDRPVYLRRLGGGDPTAVLIRLFTLDDGVEPDVVAHALGAEAEALLQRVGLVRREAGLVVATARLVPHDDILVASDQLAHEHPDHVAAVHAPSATLAHLTVRRPVRDALDVGTGNGIQALLAARHAERVVGVDLNERALAFARFNAALNGLDNVEFRAGSYFEPAEGEQFDLVVANPPYVISPETAYLFRDSGMGRDAVSEHVLRETARHLRDGAFASVMISWVQDGEDVAARPASWVAGSGCDALLVHSGTDDPLTVAAGWNRDARDDAAAYAEAIDRWLEYFRAEGIEAISFGCVVLRKRPGGGRFAAVRMPSRSPAAAGGQLERMFAAADLLERLGSDEELLDVPLVVADGLRLERVLAFTDGAWAQRGADVAQPGGLRFTAALDGVAETLLAGLDGTRPLREVLPDGPGRDSTLRMARQMLELGFLRAP